MNDVRSKTDFVARYSRGEFGNASPTWESLDDLFSKDDPSKYQLGRLLLFDHQQRWHIRNRVPGAQTWYDVDGIWLQNAWYMACQEVDPKLLYLSAMAPTRLTTIQGEVRRTHQGLELLYSQVAKPMRQALAKESATVTGLATKLLLQKHLNPTSYDWLMELLEMYQNHIVEFSTYATEWGTLPGYNTVYWEVRPDRQFSHHQSTFTEIY